MNVLDVHCHSSQFITFSNELMATRVGVSITAAMISVQFLEVGLNTLVKSANTNGMSNYVFILYSNLLAFFFLLPSTFFFYRNAPPPPPIPTSVLSRILLLSCLSTTVQTLMYTGIGYSSPTLASAMVDLIPAFTFIIAIFSRMENLNMKRHSSYAKIIGTVVSIAGALIVTLYKGLPITLSGTSGSLPNKIGTNYLSAEANSNWILGGFLLATASFCLSILIVVQTWIIKDYPEEFVVTTTACGFVVVLSAIVALFAEHNKKAWILKPDMELVSIFYSAIFVVSIRSVVTTWACRKKGPVYVAMFNPLAMVVAIAMGITFLGDTLYLGSVIGAVAIAIGFYSVMWAMAQEENMVKNNQFVPSSTAPLLPRKSTDCT
ncbi:hypothetical protein HN51_069320 [Arachis hypogaea]|uniref:WAT1-related protein n=1 Tax=Arachis hypogaea TaxID=3818 RepID=A0A444Z6P9_ARAHY|nr:WAT1-related protein At3g28050 [Arachis ipaensis]XP_025654344.1 WAT1-related protein At3g28050 [Arachis hypogaea]QHO11569.1 WAT1-related protein [Arachis hypogaea]RYR09841.1 hypothetical protein Ahy_B05g078263 [Arachis hypogaea]